MTGLGHYDRDPDATPQARAERRSLRGGAKQDLTTIAAGGCWCGESDGHDWPGRSEGAPHPRFRSPKEEVEHMTMTATETIAKKNLRSYHRDVQALLMDLINNHGVGYRIQDGNHILLYSGQESSTLRPFKVASARRPEGQMRYLSKWALEHVPSYAASLESAASTAEQVEESPPVAPEVLTVAAEEPQPTPEPEVSEYHEAATEYAKWVTYVNSEGRENTGYETDGTTIRCRECVGTDTEYVTTDARGLGGHTRVHHSETAPMWSDEARAKAVATRAARAREKKIEAAVGLIAEALGVETETTALENRIEELTEELAAANKRADDAEAKLALMREALNV